MYLCTLDCCQHPPSPLEANMAGSNQSLITTGVVFMYLCTLDCCLHHPSPLEANVAGSKQSPITTVLLYFMFYYKGKGENITQTCNI
jgi:hypothetical protein